MDVKTKGIVLRKNEYRENTALVTLLTEDLGLISVSAYGIHSAKSGVASGTQLFTYGEFTLKQKGERYELRSAEITETFGKLSATYEELVLTSRLVQAAVRIFGETAPHEAFLLLYTCLSYMSYSEMHPDDIYIYFLLRATEIAGQRPSVTNCAVCGDELFSHDNIRFSSHHGGAVCAECANGLSVQRLSLEALRRMQNIEPAEMSKIVLPDGLRAELLPLLESYYKYWYE